jgi:hypothetical protein
VVSVSYVLLLSHHAVATCTDQELRPGKTGSNGPCCQDSWKRWYEQALPLDRAPVLLQKPGMLRAEQLLHQSDASKMLWADIRVHLFGDSLPHWKGWRGCVLVHKQAIRFKGQNQPGMLHVNEHAPASMHPWLHRPRPAVYPSTAHLLGVQRWR